MNKERALAVFEDYKIRRIYDETSATWFFSVVDIIGALIQQPDYQAARNQPPGSFPWWISSGR